MKCVAWVTLNIVEREDTRKVNLDWKGTYTVKHYKVISATEIDPANSDYIYLVNEFGREVWVPKELVVSIEWAKGD